ncbi:haloacid dehalogenase type II [Xylophilus sp.]|uniref:haloacid dehalogenase type II n=1 Tax=Xylophilus sp. TaxID=2653893 RepID=UPI0013B93C42|nr:haloacid dehalogenase type II [Xylophilus sp.]KAF1042798.1 MAG: 2-haloalkanoic acid dehalogenase [Xylophilus sp.]
MPSAPIAAVLFDAYGTLFDVYSVGLAAEQLFPGRGEALGLLWRDKQIEYTRLVTSADDGAHYEPFWVLTRAALRHSCRRLGLALGAAQEAQLMNQYRALSAFPEDREVLQVLRARGIATGILSNGEPEMLGVAVRSAGLDGLFDHILSTDAVRRYKPHPATYALGPQATGVEPRRTLFVSGNGWDALGATWFGYRTLWVNRAGQPYEDIGPPPTRTGNSLRDVLSHLN